MIYDVTLPITPDLPVWPGDPKPRIVVEASLRAGDGYNLTSVHVSSHTGTHLDAPLHMVDGGTSVEELPLDRLIGDCWVARLPDEVRRIGAAELEAAEIPVGTNMLLLHTANSALWDGSPLEFTGDYAAFTPDGARWVVDRGIDLVGIDYLSVDLFDADGLPAHRLLLGSGVLTLESLDLRKVPEGLYRLICLPLRVVGVEGAPARVVLVST
jgi:arylformamidase